MSGEARSEKQLQARVVKAILRKHPQSWMVHIVGSPFQTPGIPDLLVCVHGRLIGLELKHVKPGESVEHARARTTAQQRHQIALIRNSGGVAGTAVSVEEALELIEQALPTGTNGDEELA